MLCLHNGYVCCAFPSPRLPSDKHSSRQRLSGGGYNILLPEAQNVVRVPTGYLLKKVPADGNCFYHCLITLANDGRSTSVWTVDSLRELAEQPGSEWATFVQVKKLAEALDIRINIIPVELTDSGLPLRLSEADVVGPENGANIVLLWWTREHHGLHYDALAPQDDLETQNFRQLRAAMHAQGIQAKKPCKSLHMRSALRSHHHGPLDVRQLRLPPLAMIDLEEDSSGMVDKPLLRTTLDIVSTPLDNTFGFPEALRYILLEGIQLGGLRRKIDSERLQDLVRDHDSISEELLAAIVDFLQLSLELLVFDSGSGELIRQQRVGSLHGYVRLACYEHGGHLCHVEAVRLPENLLLSYHDLVAAMRTRSVSVPKGTQLYQLRGWELGYRFPLGTPLSDCKPKEIKTGVLKKCRFIQWNAGGLRPKKGFLDDTLLESSPEIAFISESHLSPRDLLTVHGYSVAVRLDRPKGGGGGFLVLVREDVSYKVEFTSNLLGLHACIVNLPGHGDLRLGGLYYVPIASKYLPTDEEATPILQQLLFHSDIIVGDANVHFDHEALDIACGQRGSHMLDLMEDMDWQVVDLPNFSRVTRYTSTIPDILLAREGYEHAIITCMHPTPSDHMLIDHTLDVHTEVGRWTRTPRYLLARADWQLFECKLDEFLATMPGNAAHVPVQQHYLFIRHCVERAAALSIPRGRCRARAVPWQSRRCRQLRSELSAAHAIVQQDPSSSWAMALVQELRHTYREELAACKRASWQQMCTSLEHSPVSAKPFHLLKSMERHQDTVTCSGLFDPLKKKYLYKDDAKANAYAQHLYQASRPAQEHLPDIRRDQLHVRQWLTGQHASFDWDGFALVTNKEIKQALATSSKKKAPGHDRLPTELWQHGGSRLVTHLALLFSKILIGGDIPADWLLNLACPVLKPGKDPTDISSHRPISLLCSSQKVFEKVLLGRLRGVHLHSAQHGFRPGVGATTALATVTHLLHGWVTSSSSTTTKTQNRVGMLCLDITGAFDHILPSTLASKLIAKGVPFPILRYIWRWTRGRMVAARWNGRTSRPKVVRIGLPQGSSLSPLLFNIYMDDMLTSLASTPGWEPIAYADDISLLARGSTVEEVERSLTSALAMTHQHLARLGLKLSPAKCSVCLFTPFGQEHRRPLVVQCPWLASKRQLSTAESDLQPRLRMVGKHVLALSRLDPSEGEIQVEIASGQLPALYVPRRQDLALGSAANTLIPSASCKLTTVDGRQHFQVSDLEGNPEITAVPVVHAVRSVRLLGVYLETSLSFKSHLQASRKKFHNALALVRRLSGASWGPSSKLLRQLAKVFVQARVLHGLVALLPFASPSLASQIDRWDAALARAILRCPHGTCAKSSLLEAGLQPLSEIVAIQAAKLVVQSHHPLSPRMLQQCRLLPVGNFAKNQAGWFALGRARLESIHLEPVAVELPLYPLDRPTVDIHMVNFQDSRRLPKEVRRRTFLTEYALHVDPGTVVVVSDGSVVHDRLGGAATVRLPDGQFDLHSLLGHGHASAHAELQAFGLALDHLDTTMVTGKHLLWITDSIAATSVFSSSATHGSSTKQHVLSRIASLAPSRLTIIKAPSHCDVPDHDHVDALAGAAAMLPGPVPYACVPWSGARKQLVAAGFDAWTSLSPEKSTHNTFQKMVAARQKRWQWTLSLPRGLCMQDASLLHGMRVHRHKFFAEVHELAGRDPPLCQCGAALTWEHVYACAILTTSRGPHLPTNVDRPCDLLYSHPRLVLKALTGMGIYKYKQEKSNICTVYRAEPRRRSTDPS